MRKILVCLFYAVAILHGLSGQVSAQSGAYVPSAVLDSSEMTGTIGDIQDDPAAPDSSWIRLDPPPVTDEMQPDGIPVMSHSSGTTLDIQDSPDASDGNWLTTTLNPPIAPRLAPNSIVTSYALTGVVADVGDDPDSPDGNWLVADSNEEDVYAEFGFVFPSEGLQVGANLQEFRVLVRYHNQGASNPPRVRLHLFENNTELGQSDLLQIDVSEAIVAWTWDASLLSNPAATNVTVYVETMRSGGNPNSRTSVDIGAVEWHALAVAPNDSDLRVTFDPSTHAISDVADGQTFRALLRPVGTGTPDYRMELWESGALVRAGAATALPVEFEDLYLAPDGILENTNLSGLLADIQDAPDSADINWMTASVGDADTSVRVSFPTPTSNLSTGSHLQQFRVRVREHIESGGSSSAQYQLELWENGTLKSQKNPSEVLSGPGSAALAPDSVLEFTNLVGTAETILADVDEDPDAPDSNWTTAVDGTGDVSLRLSFPTPAVPLQTGAGLQEFRVQVREHTESGSYANTNSYRLEVWEAGVLVQAGADTSLYTAPAVVSLLWDASSLLDPSGADVELRVYGIGDSNGVSGGTGTLDVGAAEWIAATEDQGSVVSFTWSASLLSDLSGTGVELRVHGLSDSAYSTTGTIEVGAAEWIARVDKYEVVQSFDWTATELADPSGANAELRIVGLSTGDNSLEVGAVEWVASNDLGAEQHLRLGFDDPASLLFPGADLQKVQVALESATGNSPPRPIAGVEVIENGVVIQSIAAQDIQNGGGSPMLLELPWNRDLLTDPTGTGVEFKIVATPGTGGQPSVYVHAVRFLSTESVSPSIGGAPDTAVNEDTAYAFTALGADVNLPHGDTLTYSIANQPSWTSFDTQTGALTGMPGNDDVGSHPGIEISVTDSQGLVATLPAFAISVANVNDTPIISGAPDFSVNEDESYSFTPNVSDDDLIHGDVLTFSVENLPGWAAFDPATGLITGIPVELDMGVYSGVVVSVTDLDLATTSLAAFDIQVLHVNDPPTITGSPPPDTATEDMPYSYAATAEDVDLVHIGIDSHYCAVDVVPQWLSCEVTSTPGSTSIDVQVTGIPDDAAVGVHSNVTITIFDSMGEQASLSPFTLTVGDVNDLPTFLNAHDDMALRPAKTLSLSFAVQDDDLIHGGEVLTFTVNGAVVGASPSVIPGSSWITAAKSGDGTVLLGGTPGQPNLESSTVISISVADLASASDSVPDFAVSVHDTSPMFSGMPRLSIYEGESYAFIPLIEDPDGDILVLAASGLPPWLSFDSSTGEVSGTAPIDGMGTYGPIEISATDETFNTTKFSAFSIAVKTMVPDAMPDPVNPPEGTTVTVAPDPASLVPEPLDLPSLTVNSKRVP